MTVSKTRSAKMGPMDAGFLAPLIADFEEALGALGHTSLTIRGYTDSARHFATWACAAGLGFADIGQATIARFADHHCQCAGVRRRRGVSRKYANRAGRFVRFLAERGSVAPAMAVVPDPVPSRVLDYQRWLTVHRGLSPRTVSRQGRMVRRLLFALGEDPQGYDAAAIRAAFRAEAQQCSPNHIRTMTSALRGYLRFLAASGLCRLGLDQAVPPVLQWRLSALPRYLPAADVERVVATCEGSRPLDLRDRAVLLLLARLGLRAGDVWDLRLVDFDWAAGALHVCGKSRRGVRLPLPQDVGDAVLAYIERGRPVVSEDRLFLRSAAPYVPFTTSSSISNIVARALRQAGIEDPPSTGASLLRHSAATAMLRGGATLQAVGAVLAFPSDRLRE